MATFEEVKKRDFPGGLVVKNPPCNAGDTDSTPGPRRFHMPQSSETQILQLLSSHAATIDVCAPRACA